MIIILSTSNFKTYFVVYFYTSMTCLPTTVIFDNDPYFTYYIKIYCSFFMKGFF